MKVKFEGLTQVLSEFDSLLNKVAGPFGNGIGDEIADICITEIKSRTPVRTGRLQRGNKKGRITKTLIEIENKVPYGIYVDGRREFFYVGNDGQQKLVEKVMESHRDSILQIRITSYEILSYRSGAAPMRFYLTDQEQLQ